MTNSDALTLIAKLVAEFDSAKRSRVSENEMKELFHERIVGLSLTRQLAPVAELLAKAWLEYAPGSREARDTVADQLYVVGRPEEGQAIEQGGDPTPVEEDSEENMEWSRKNAERTANAG